MADLVPVPSATVTLVREGDAGVEVLMMRRNLKSGFVPGMYLFPGGAVDEDDDAPSTAELSTHLADDEASRRLGIDRGGLAYWVAAIRESFEEAGLMLAYDESGGLVTLKEPGTIERFCGHRDALNAGTCSLLEILKTENLALAADQLVYFSHWITPLSAPRRYDTRFFVAKAPPNQVPLHDNTETISHVWVNPAQAVDAFRKNEFKMRFPTVRTLEEFAPYATVDELLKAMRAKREIPTILPRINKQGVRLLPGDPGYDDVFTNEEHGQWKL